MLSSSIQATLAGRFGKSEYGLFKKAGEELFFGYAAETGAKVLVYRFPNLVGKWVRPNYNSAVGTFCNNIANNLPITVNDPSVVLEMLFIDDLVEEMFDALEGKEHRCEYPGVGEVVDGVIYDGLTPRYAADGRYCCATVTHKATLGYIVECLHKFHAQPTTLIMPQIAPGSFEKKLYSMYLSYLPADNAFAVVSDSGTLPEESSFFTSIGHPIPAVCIRTSTERPEALDKGCFILSGIDTVGLLQAVDTAVEMVRDEVNGGAIPVWLLYIKIRKGTKKHGDAAERLFLFESIIWGWIIRIRKKQKKKWIVLMQN